MKKALKFVIFFIIIALIIFTIITIRKFIIINKIENKLSNMGKLTNYYLKITNENSNINNSNYNIYRRFNDMKIAETGFDLQVSFSADDTYTLNKEKKVYLKSSSSILDDINDYYPLTKYFSKFTENEQNAFEQLKLAIRSNIKTTDFRGTECYAISIKWKDVDIENVSTYYVDKENLLFIANEFVQEDEKLTTVYEAEFNTQTEEDFSKEKILEGFSPLNLDTDNN